MTKLYDLQGAIERLIAGVSSEADRKRVQSALLAGQLVYTEGARSVAVGGDVTGTVIITGDQNQLSFDIDPTKFSRLRDHLFPAPRGLPPPFPALLFIGRYEALAQVKAIIGVTAGTGTSKRPIVVSGLPGVGKTTLVSVLSRDPDVARAYPDGVLWTSLDQKPALMSLLAGWGRALGREDLLNIPTADEAVAQLRAILQQKRMLLIVDDVWDAGHGALFQQAQGVQCGLLFTTRLPEVATLLSQGHDFYSLPVLSEDDALALMHILVPAIVTQHPEACRALVRSLECLPLALHVAARLLREESRMGWEVMDLLQEIQDGAKLIEELAPADRVKDSTIPTVQALLRKSTDVLEEQVRDCFAFLGAFAPKPATFDVRAMQAVWEVEDPKPIARKLVAHGLLEPVETGRFRLHALLVAHAKSLWRDSSTIKITAPHRKHAEQS